MLRHVSRTHRVALDWSIDRINLDPKNQNKYVDTTNQLADMLTEGSFTCDVWCNLLRLFNLVNFPCSLAVIFAHEKATNMSKRIQERKTEEESALR